MSGLFSARSRLVLGVGVVITLSSGASLASAQSAGAKRRFELADYYKLETASAPAISPDGRYVAYVRTRIIESDNRRHSEIWLAQTDGAAPPVRITNPALSSSAPRWSPDGALLAFTSRRTLPGSSESSESSSTWFLRMDEPGGEAFQIPGVEGAPIFSPDGQWIAFTKPTPPAPKSKPQYATEFDRQIAERFKGRVYDWVQYRFDGRGYLQDPRDPLASPPQELYVVGRAGGVARQLTSLGVNVRDVAWRPDSAALAFVANSHERDEYVYERADLWTIPLNGAVKRLTDDGYDHSEPAWSPDGRTLVFQRELGLTAVIAARQTHGAPVDLARIAVDGGPIENLTKDWDLLPDAPRYAPDGRTIYFRAGVGGASHLFRLPASGGPVEQATTGDRELGAFSFSGAFDRAAYTAADATRPAEVLSARFDGARFADERTLSGVNDALLAGIDPGRTERLKYRSKDGTEVEGWVVLPPDYDRSRGPYPLILNIHGGPHSAYGVGLSFPFQLLAANGYIALYTNPRGSTGYGEKFLWATWGGGWGNLDFDDVMAGVDAAAARYAVDQKRLGVAGYSYGGFLTNWVITHTNRFAAAVVGAGISNWVSDYGTADIPRTKESEFSGAPWEPRGAELLLRQSPVLHAGSVTTPTLFVHGEADARVPIEQGEQMYLALKKRRVPAKFVRYPDMYHTGWTPWNTVHRYDQELKWWTQYLGPSAVRGTGAQQ